MSVGKTAPLVIHGWTVFAHPLFLAQIEALARQVESFKQKDPAGYVKKNPSKRLVAITRLAFDVIPQDPTRPEYRQGSTLGGDHKHWFRAKFFQQYRLFFRYHTPGKVIVFAWVNDEDTQRAHESGDDAYRVFRKMLDSGHPPNDWSQLLAEARAEGLRLQQFAAGSSTVMSETTFMFRVDEILKTEFSTAAKARDRSGAQLLRDFMREFVQQQQDAAAHEAWFRHQVQIGLDSANAGDVIPADEVEAEAEAWRAETRRKMADIDKS